MMLSYNIDVLKSALKRVLAAFDHVEVVHLGQFQPVLSVEVFESISSLYAIHATVWVVCLLCGAVAVAEPMDHANGGGPWGAAGPIAHHLLSARGDWALNGGLDCMHELLTASKTVTGVSILIQVIDPSNWPS